jgi:small neutral amino acid transporter SnatA (MarC family)
MKEHFDNIVRGIVGAYQEHDAPLQNREVVLEAQKRDLDRDHEEAVAVHKDACDHFKQNNPGIPPETQRRHTRVYWFVSFVLFLLEFPMNFAAFQIFGDNANLLTSLTAFMVGGILLGSAHFMGIEWRRGPFSNRQSLSVFLTSLAMPVLAILGVATLRSLHFTRQDQGDLSKMPVSLLFLSFAIFNLGIFLVAALLSRWAHPVGAEQVLDARSRLQRANDALAQLTNEREALMSSREVLRLKHETEAHMVTDQHLELMKRYLMENVRVRSGKGVNGAALPKFLLDAPPQSVLNVSLKVSLPPLIARRSQKSEPVTSPTSEADPANASVSSS